MVDGLRRQRRCVVRRVRADRGAIEDRSGSFVLQHVGTFDGQTAKAEVLVVPGSGTGDLRDLTGKGSFLAGMGPEGERSIALDYDL